MRKTLWMLVPSATGLFYWIIVSKFGTSGHLSMLTAGGWLLFVFVMANIWLSRNTVFLHSQCQSDDKNELWFPLVEEIKLNDKTDTIVDIVWFFLLIISAALPFKLRIYIFPLILASFFTLKNTISAWLILKHPLKDLVKNHPVFSIWYLLYSSFLISAIFFSKLNFSAVVLVMGGLPIYFLLTGGISLKSILKSCHPLTWLMVSAMYMASYLLVLLGFSMFYNSLFHLLK